MSKTPQSNQAVKEIKQETLAVRFPAPPRPQMTTRRRHAGLGDLVPRRWRRVVILGQKFWMPG